MMLNRFASRIRIHRDIIWFGWAYNRRIAYVQDKQGDENWQAYAVDIDGANFLALTPFEGVKVQPVDGLEEDDDHVLIALNRRDKRIFDVYRLNVNTAELKLIAENPGNVTRWVTDNDGKLRVAVATDGANISLLYRNTESGPFKAIITTNFKSAIRPLFFTFDNRFLYVSSNVNRDKSAIYKYDIENGKHLDLIYEHPEVDVNRLLRSKKRKVITGVGYITTKHQFHFFDEKRKKRANVLAMTGKLKQAGTLIDQASHLMASADISRQDSRTTHTEALIRANLSIYSGDINASLRDARFFVELANRSGSTWAIAVSASTLAGRI